MSNIFYEKMRSLEGKYNPPKMFEHGKETLVAELKSEGGDGQDVEIYECRMPAVFFTIKVLPTPDSLGRMQEGYQISFGSSMHQLTCDMANAIVRGMVSVERTDKSLTN